MTVNVQDFQKFGQINTEAPMKAFAEWQKGMQTIAGEMATYSKRSFEDGQQTLEKLMGVKSFDQVMEIQTSFAKRAAEDYMQQLNRIGGLYSDFAKEATKPLAGMMQQGR